MTRPNLWTIEQAASEMGCSVRTARKWIAAGLLSAHQSKKLEWMGGASHLYRPSDVRRAAAEWKRLHPR